MSSSNLQTLLRMQERRYSHPFRHALATFLHGNPQNFRRRISGPLSRAEGAMLYTFASELPAGSIIVEIGTLRGKSTAYLGLGAQKSDSKVYAVDPFDSEIDRQMFEVDSSKYLIDERKLSREAVRENLDSLGLCKTVELIQGFSTDVAKGWVKGRVDFLWIDGNHQQAKQDWDSWKPHLSDDARVSFHDSHPIYAPEWQTVLGTVRGIVERENVYDLEQINSMTSFRVRK